MPLKTSYSKFSLFFNHLYRRTLYPAPKKLESFLISHCIQSLPKVFPRLNTAKAFGIPKGITSIKSFPKQTIYPSKTINRPPPKTLYSKISDRFPTSTTIPEANVLALPNGIVTQKGGVLTANGDLIEELTIQYGLQNILDHKLFRIRLKNFWKKCQHFNGTVAWLTMDKQGNLAHWCYDILPRLDLYKKGGYSPDKIYVKLDHDYQLESLKLMGFRDDQIIDANIYPFISADIMLVGTTPCSPGVPNDWICRFLRESYLSNIHRYLKDHRFPKCIYISRSLTPRRQIHDEDKLIKLLKKYGFVLFRPEQVSFLKSAAYFANADVILSPHGAALSRLVFSKPKSKCIEILSNHLANVFYWHLCEENSIDYYYLEGKATDLNQGRLAKGHKSSLTVNLDHLEQTFKLADIAPDH